MKKTRGGKKHGLGVSVEKHLPWTLHSLSPTFRKAFTHTCWIIVADPSPLLDSTSQKAKGQLTDRQAEGGISHNELHACTPTHTLSVSLYPARHSRNKIISPLRSPAFTSNPDCVPHTWFLSIPWTMGQSAESVEKSLLLRQHWCERPSRDEKVPGIRGGKKGVEAAEESHNGALQRKKKQIKKQRERTNMAQNFWDYLPTRLSHPSLFSSFALFGKMSLWQHNGCASIRHAQYLL